jgi:hypothetical protein
MLATAPTSTLTLMGAEDEFRKVAEDVRELARALRQEMRSAQRDARDVARQAREQIRTEFQSSRHKGRPPWQSNYSSSSRPHQHYPVKWGSYGAPPAWANRPPRPPKPPKPERPKAPPIRHKHDGSTLVSLLLVLAGLAWLVSETHLFNVSLEAVLAVALAILGAGMVVTARTDWNLSRRSWPVWIGAALLVVLLAASNSNRIDAGLSSLNFGPSNFSPTTWTSAKTSVDNFAGPISVDLVTLSPPADAAAETLTIRDTFGPITITLPQTPGYHIHLKMRSVFGGSNLPANASETGGGHGSTTADIGPATGPTLTIDAQTIFGPVNVRSGAKPS